MGFRVNESFIQFVKFSLVGFSNTLISYIVYLCLIYFDIHYLVASIVGFVISVINSFYWNNKYVFKSNCNNTKSIFFMFIKTFISYAGTGLLLANLLLYVWVDMLKIQEFIAPLINLGITIPLNFLLNKFWAFKYK